MIIDAQNLIKMYTYISTVSCSMDKLKIITVMYFCYSFYETFRPIFNRFSSNGDSCKKNKQTKKDQVG